MLSVVTLYFVLMALLGGVAFIFFESRSWEDLRRYRNVRHLVLAAVAGVIWFLYYPEWGFPAAITAFIFGWFAPSFFEGLMRRADID